MGRYVRSILNEFTSRLTDRVALTLLVPDLLPALAARRYRAGLPPDIAVARRTQAGRLGLDLVWYPWNGMTWIAPGRKIATVHDCWPFVGPNANEKIRRNEQTPFLTTAAHADLIIADSQFAKGEIERHLGFDPAKIEVVPLGVPRLDGSRGTTAPVQGPYLLFVGEADTRKDLGTLLRAMSLLPAALRETYTLVIVGRGQPGDAGAPLPGTRVVFEGVVDDRRLIALYSSASAFVLPSSYEGFGLPVLEAMSFGVPVVASDAASIPEVGGDAAIYFPSGDAGALARAIESVLTDAALAARLRDAGRARAAVMTWDRCADRTLSIFERLAKS